MAEKILAVIPLPLDLDTVGRVMAALAAEFPGASARDGGQWGNYLSRTGASVLPAQTLEVFVKDDKA